MKCLNQHHLYCQWKYKTSIPVVEHFFLVRCCSSSLLSFLSYLSSSSKRVQEEEKAVALKVDCPFGPSSLSWFKHFKCPEEKKEKFPSAQQSFPSSFLGCGFFMLSLFRSHDVLRSLFSPSRKSRRVTFVRGSLLMPQKEEEDLKKESAFILHPFLSCLSLSFPFKEIKTKLGFQG